jgi:hypothetical protein
LKGSNTLPLYSILGIVIPVDWRKILTGNY